jgi:hypothetical protein
MGRLNFKAEENVRIWRVDQAYKGQTIWMQKESKDQVLTLHL